MPPRSLTPTVSESTRQTPDKSWDTERLPEGEAKVTAVRQMFDAGLTNKLSRELVELRKRWGEESQTLNLGIYRRECKRQRSDAGV